MQKNDDVAILINKIIKSRYNSLSDLAKKLQISNSTLTRNIRKHSRQFLIQLKSLEVPIPDDLINPPIEKIKAVISHQDINYYLKENVGDHSLISINDLRKKIIELNDEVNNLKIENYDLKKKLEELINGR